MPEPQAPLALANFIIARAITDQQPVTNRKLNKLIFLIQGYWLAHYHQPLATLTFNHDPAGPLEATVYPHFKFAGSFPLNSLATQIDPITTNLYLTQPHLTLPMAEQIVLAKLVHTLNQLPSHRLTSLINHHAVLTNRVYTDAELIACYQAIAAVCQHLAKNELRPS